MLLKTLACVYMHVWGIACKRRDFSSHLIHSIAPPSLPPFLPPSLPSSLPPSCSNGYYIPGGGGSSSVSVGVASLTPAHSQSGSVTKVLSLLSKQMQLFTLSFDSW